MTEPIVKGRNLVKRFGSVTGLNHADFDLLANIQHVLDLFRGCSPTIAPLTFGQGAFHVVFQADNGTEAGELGDLALDDPAFLITLVDLF